METGKNYSWAVRAQLNSQWGDYSPEWTFKVRMSVSVDLGSNNDADGTNGIAHPSVGDGETEIVSIINECNSNQVTLRRNIGGSSNDRFFYFKIFDGFVYDGVDGSGKQDTKRFHIKIQFWNHQDGSDNEMCIYYDSYNPDPNQNYRTLDCVTIGTTDCMRTIEYDVTDARFKNSLANQSDIKIRASSSSPYSRRYINTVTVTRLP